MSFNRLDFDTCAYQQNLAESIGPGEYKLGEPMVGGAPCFAADPNIRLQYAGVSFDKNKSMVDTNSDLLNITRDASNCSMKKHLPQFDKATLWPTTTLATPCALPNQPRNIWPHARTSGECWNAASPSPACPFGRCERRHGCNSVSVALSYSRMGLICFCCPTDFIRFNAAL